MTYRFALPFVFALVAVNTFMLPSHAAVKTQDVKYTVGGTEYVGFLAVDDASKDKRPGILICPEWVGVNDYARGRAKQLAEMGYVALVFDPYGGGKMASDVKQASEWATALKNNRPELRARVNAAFATLKKQEQVDTSKTAAIGYCFGGTSALELARSGADVLGVVSFHGALATPTPAKAGELKAKILVCHGADDPFVPPAEVAGFEKEMREAKADWQLISYGNAVHSFTNPGASKAGLQGVAYEERADKRSWQAMKDFFVELFGTPQALRAQRDFAPERWARVDKRMELLVKSRDELQLVIRALIAQLGGANHPAVVNRTRELDKVNSEIQEYVAELEKNFDLRVEKLPRG